jgi:NADPH-dependent curcumin reductase CurA
MYNATEMPMGPRLLGHLIVKRATVQGLLVTDFGDKFREAIGDLTRWYEEGKLRVEERITDGIENAPTAFMEMLQGANTGKQLVRLHRS